MTDRTVVAVSGNPRRGSRTHAVGRGLADQLIKNLGWDATVDELEVIEHADELFVAPDRRSASFEASRTTLRSADLAVIATPVYKASYTGLLKSFLDHYAAGELGSVVAVPVVVAGRPAHTFVGEHYLRPLLTELGAVVATPAFVISEAQLAGVDDLIADWVERYAPVLARQLATSPDREDAGVAQV